MLVLPPKGWSLKRIQGYFVWSKAVIAGTQYILIVIDMQNSEERTKD